MTESRKLRLAYFSPLNPVQSGISDYSEDLLPWLARYAEIDLYLDNYQPSNPEISQSFGVYPASQYSKQAGRYEATLFHMGNNREAHSYIYQALQKSAGQSILVLHDYILHHFMFHEFISKSKPLDYIRLMQRIYGKEAEKAAREFIKGHFPTAMFDYPLCETSIEAAKAVLVHSQYARDLILQKYPQKRVGLARMGGPLPETATRAEARTRLGLPQDEFIAVSLGHLNPYKRLDSALWAFKGFSRDYPNSRYILVGSQSSHYNVKAMIQALGLEAKTQLTGYASGEAYRDYLAAADVCINLRYPTAGETSASLLRIMGAGRPVLVSRTGAFEELPDEVCIKVDVDDAEEELLLEYLKLLANRPELARQLGQNARRHVAENQRPADSAHDYYLFLCQTLGRTPEIEPLPLSEAERKAFEDWAEPLPEFEAGSRDMSIEKHVLSDTLLGDIAQSLAELGISDDDPLLGEAAEILKFVE